MKKKRKHYTSEEKVAILRRHLLEQVPISELYDKQGLQPTVLYRRQKEFFEKRDGCVSAESWAQPFSRARTDRYPQSNGKIERWHKSLKSECIQPGTPLTLEDALVW